MSKIDEQKTLYRLASAEQEARLAEFTEVDNPLDRTHEIALLKLMVENALAAGQPSLADKLMSTMGAVSRIEFRRRLVENELFGPEALMRFAKALCDIVSEEIRDKFVGWEDVLLRISDRSAEALGALENTESELRGLRL